jgi:hypothetical protein
MVREVVVAALDVSALGDDHVVTQEAENCSGIRSPEGLVKR